MRSISRLQLCNAFLGNLFEHYDSAIFGFLSPFLAPLIFPEQDALTALILTYAILPLGMLARPIGSLVFGYIGDVYGRPQALFLSFVGMSIISGAIALSPTYLQVGIWAPIIFAIGRALQNFLVAGETMGGAIFLLENSPTKHHDLLSSFYSASAMAGHLLASLGVFLLSRHHIINPGWRFLYLAGCLTALFGCILRRIPYQSQQPLKSSQNISNLKTMFWQCRKPLLLTVICAGFAHANYAISLILMNGFIPLVTTLTKTEMMEINTYLLVLDFAAFPFFGWLASKMSREKLMLFSALGLSLLSLPLILVLEGGNLAVVVAVRVVFVLLGVAFFAPFHAWTQQLFPANCRYVVSSFGYALGSQLLGSPTAAFALWSYQKTGMVSSVVWYWMFLGLASCLAIGLKKAHANQALQN